jgi:sugar phosphate isomerase/epimerase
MHFGAMENVFTTTAPDSIDDAADAGYDGIELVFHGPDPAEEPLWTPDGRDRARRRARERGIEIASICLGFLNAGGLTSDDPETRSMARDAVRRAPDAAAALDADAVLVPFFGSAEITEAEEEDRLVEGITAVADAAEATDVTLALENTLSAAKNQELLDAIDSPSVGCYYDVGNSHSFGNDPAAEIRDLGEDVARIHFKDRSRDAESFMLGEGPVDFDAVREAIDDIGYDDWIVLETPAPEDPVEDARKNLAFARSVFE